MDESDTPSTAAPRSLFRRALWWGFYLAAWCVVAMLAAAVIVRLFDFDGTHLLVCLNSFTRYVYLPAYACLAWAMWQRRWLLASVAAVVVVCHIGWMKPDFVRDRRFDASPATATMSASPTLRIFFANVNVENQEHQSLLNEIAAANPDVVVLVEFSWPWHIAFQSAPVMAPYKYGTGWLRSHIGSVNVFSKLPLKLEQQEWVRERAVHTVDLPLGGQTLRLVGLHAPRPVGHSKSNYYPYWEYMLPKLKAEPGPLVVVGDFNATEHSRVYRELTADRLRSAHDDRGRGWATTWPNGAEWAPPIRIDQAFLSPEVECVRIVEGKGRGSDHRPLVIDVRIRDASPAPTGPLAD